MLTDKQILHIVNHDLGDAVVQLAPYLEEHGIREAVITLAFHHGSDLPFICLWNPDGPILAFAPYVPDSAKFLHEVLATDESPYPEAALRWANQQRWEVVAERRITYVGDSANGR